LELSVWPHGDGQFILDDKNVDYVAVATAADTIQATPANASGVSMAMMASSLSTSYAYSNPVYLTNMTATRSGSVGFGIAGGTNFVPYNILNKHQ